MSSTKLLRDENEKPIGALLINFYTEPNLQMPTCCMDQTGKRAAVVDINSVIFAGSASDRVVSFDRHTHVVNQVDQNEPDKIAASDDD